MFNLTMPTILPPSAKPDPSVAKAVKQSKEHVLVKADHEPDEDSELAALNERLVKIPKKGIKTDITPAKVFNILPESSVWCHGDRRQNRICKFRNLCFQYDRLTQPQPRYIGAMVYT
jgi:hypothetical protein